MEVEDIPNDVLSEVYHFLRQLTDVNIVNDENSHDGGNETLSQARRSNASDQLSRRSRDGLTTPKEQQTQGLMSPGHLTVRLKRYVLDETEF